MANNRNAWVFEGSFWDDVTCPTRDVYSLTVIHIVQVLIRLISADEPMYNNCTDAVQWMEDTNVLEMIVDKFSSSVSYCKSLSDICWIQVDWCQNKCFWNWFWRIPKRCTQMQLKLSVLWHDLLLLVLLPKSPAQSSICLLLLCGINLFFPCSCLFCGLIVDICLCASLQFHWKIVSSCFGRITAKICPC